MKHLKKIIGWFLVSLPVDLALALIWLDDGLIATLACVGLLGLLIGAFWLGSRLIDGE